MRRQRGWIPGLRVLGIGPRDMIDGMLLVGSLWAFAYYALSQRVPLSLDVIRDRRVLFRERAGRRERSTP